MRRRGGRITIASFLLSAPTNESPRRLKAALEFHDSDVVELRHADATLRMIFEPAYVHRSTGRPGVDSGSGFLQPAEIVFSGAQFTEKDGPCKGAISEGLITVSGKRFDSVFPLPYTVTGKVSAEFTFESGAVLSITATGVSCASTGPAQLVDGYEG